MPFQHLIFLVILSTFTPLITTLLHLRLIGSAGWNHRKGSLSIVALTAPQGRPLRRSLQGDGRSGRPCGTAIFGGLTGYSYHQWGLDYSPPVKLHASMQQYQIVGPGIGTMCNTFCLHEWRKLNKMIYIPKLGNGQPYCPFHMYTYMFWKFVVFSLDNTRHAIMSYPPEWRVVRLAKDLEIVQGYRRRRPTRSCPSQKQVYSTPDSRLCTCGGLLDRAQSQKQVYSTPDTI